MKKTTIAVLLLAFVGAGLGLGQAKHPSELKYPGLKYDPPDPKAFRTAYAGGLRWSGGGGGFSGGGASGRW